MTNGENNGSESCVSPKNDPKPKMTLDYVLNDPQLQLSLLYYLEASLEDENLLFWMDAERLYSEPPVDIASEVARIYSTYFVVGSQKEINTSSQCRTLLQKRIQEDPNDNTVFIKIQKGIFHHLNTESFPRFLKSNYYSNPSLVSPRRRHSPSEPISPILSVSSSPQIQRRGSTTTKQRSSVKRFCGFLGSSFHVPYLLGLKKRKA
eukprot:TRINITY_DN4161_c0_g1_i1.p1 TRINITY_DN4161_c0_g1~~TRINITY_DN4161_c0_g1_i1.p1  ORF type:complete len:206 (-),score=63.52 TRINITY_DN4161_c0_g1_i1:213-830(-)